MIFRRIIFLFLLTIGLPLAWNHSYAETANSEAGEPAKEEQGEKKEGINITELVFGHVSDSHEWHLFSLKSKSDPESETSIALPLPMIIYQPGVGLKIFLSNVFDEWTKTGDGLTMISNSHDGYHIEKAMKEKVMADDGGKVYDLSVTKNILSMLIGIFLLLWAMLSVAKAYQNTGTKKAPKGFQNFVEVVIIFIRDEVAKPNIGPKFTKFMPLLLTIFFFIWINNLLGLLPGGANFTGNIAVTACLALVTFIVMMASSNKHFWSHLLNPPNVQFLVKGLLILIELMSLLIKPIALTIRLFANMLAGHIVILSVICMIFIFALLNQFVGIVFVPVSIAFSIFMFMLELLVAAIQAFIFTNLAAVFIGQSVEEGHGHEEAHGTEVAKAH